MFEFSREKPIYLQIAEWLENEILKGNIREGERLPSQADIAEALDVNPMTANKGVAVLETRGVIEKRRRGCGIYVLPDAKARIYEYRKNQAFDGLLDELFCEADALGLSTADIIRLLSERQRNRVHNAGYKSSN